jgi:hypothetical protein
MAKKTLKEAADQILNKSIKSAHKEAGSKLSDPDGVDHGAALVANDDELPDYAKSVDNPDDSKPPRDKMQKIKEEEADLEEEWEDDEEEDDSEEDEGEEEDMKEEKFSFANVLESKFKYEATGDLAKIFEGVELTDEFKEKAATIFEAAVRMKVKEIQGKLYETADQILEEAVEGIYNELSESISDFMKVTMTEWVEDNQIAIQSNIRTELAENFMDELKNLLKEHYIEVPEDKVDLVEELSDKVSALEEALNEEIAEKTQNHKYIKELEAQSVLNSLVRKNNLTLSQEEKIKELAEDVDVGDTKKYAKQVSTLIETFILNEEKVETTTQQTLKEEVQASVSETKVIDADVSRLISGIKKFSR